MSSVSHTPGLRTEPRGLHKASPGHWKLAVSGEPCTFLKAQITKFWFLEVIAAYRKRRAAVSEVLVVVRQFPKPLKGETSDTVVVVPEKKLPFMKWKLPYNCLSTASISFWASVFSRQTYVYPNKQVFLRNYFTSIKTEEQTIQICIRILEPAQATRSQGFSRACLSKAHFSPFTHSYNMFYNQLKYYI